MNESNLATLSIIWPGVRSDSVKAPSEPVTAEAIPSCDMARTLTPSTPAPPRVTRPLISTPGSSITSSGFVAASTFVPRTDFAE